MKKLILFLVFGMLLLASGARAEITYMNCKFNEGWHQKGAKYEEVKKKSIILNIQFQLHSFEYFIISN